MIVVEFKLIKHFPYFFFFVVSSKLTLAGLRRLLEEDLGLEEKSLDSFKVLIRDQVDEVCIICHYCSMN